MLIWKGPGILKADRDRLKPGEIIPAGLLSQDVLDNLIKAGKVEEIKPKVPKPEP